MRLSVTTGTLVHCILVVNISATAKKTLSSNKKLIVIVFVILSHYTFYSIIMTIFNRKMCCVFSDLVVSVL